MKHVNIYKFSKDFLSQGMLLMLCVAPIPLSAKPLHIGGGFGYNGNYFNQNYFPIIAAAMNGALAQTFSQFNAAEEEAQNALFPDSSSPPVGVDKDGNELTAQIEKSNLSQAAGGCPDTTVLLKEETPLEGREGASIVPQLLRLYGVNCAATSTSGNSLGLSAFEIDFVAQYDFLPWLFVRSGFSFGSAAPISYKAGIQYSADAHAIKVSGIEAAPGETVPTVAAHIQVNSKAKVSYSGWHLQIPILLGFYAYQDEDSALYFAFGPTLSTARFVRKVEAVESRDAVVSQEDGGRFTVGGEDGFVSVKNVDALNNSLGLMHIIGARRRLQGNLSFHMEFRWLLAGSADITTQGTIRSADTDYASDTLAAQVFENLAPGSVAQALQDPSSSDPSVRKGGRRANGLNLSYNMRILFGLSYLIDL